MLSKLLHDRKTLLIEIQSLTRPSLHQIRDWYQVQSKALSNDLPREPIPSVDEVTTELTTPKSSAQYMLWLARNSNQEPVATAALLLFTNAQQGHLACLNLQIHPAHRQDEKIGSALLTTVIRSALVENRRSITAEAIKGTYADNFLSAKGFRPVNLLTELLLRLDVTDKIESNDSAKKYLGYRLKTWRGAAPDHLIEVFVEAKKSIADRPLGKLDFGIPHWDAAEVHALAKSLNKQGKHLHTTALIDTKDGNIAGFTELILPNSLIGRAWHNDTVVAPALRGQGVGFLIKTVMLQQIKTIYPDIKEIYTINADSNLAMLKINLKLGFRPIRQVIDYQLNLT